MRIKIICAGKVKKNYPLSDLCAFYQERILSPLAIEDVVCADYAMQEKIHHMCTLINQQHEALWVLDKTGSLDNEHQCAKNIALLKCHGTKQLNIVIGGPNGLAKKTLSIAQRRISFGKVTWNHLLMRILTLDLIYRCEKISSNHPYART